MDQVTQRARVFLRVGLTFQRDALGHIQRIEIVHTLNGWWTALLIVTLLRLLGVNAAAVGELVARYLLPHTP